MKYFKNYYSKKKDTCGYNKITEIIICLMFWFEFKKFFKLNKCKILYGLTLQRIFKNTLIFVELHSPMMKKESSHKK